MKKLFRSISIVVFLFAVAFLSSCSQFGNLDIQKRHYNKGFYVHRSEKHDAVSAEEKTMTAAVAETATEIQQPVAVGENVAAPVAQPSRTVAVQQQAAEESNLAVRPAVEKPATHANAAKVVPVKTKTPASIVLHDRQAPAGPASGDVDLLILVILALLLPPLAVFLKEGDLTINFWIDLLLCLLFFLPGVIFALLVVFDVV